MSDERDYFICLERENEMTLYSLESEVEKRVVSMSQLDVIAYSNSYGG